MFWSVSLLLVSIFLRFVHSHNRAKLNYTLRLNHLSDISDNEFEMMKGQGDMDSPTIQKEINQIPQLRIKIPKEPLPKNLDWRNYGWYIFIACFPQCIVYFETTLLRIRINLG